LYVHPDMTPVPAPTPVDRSHPLPLWAQVLTSLRARLQNGEFAERFPTDEQLVADYDVSRQTVREAVRRLADEGLLERARGRATRVKMFEHAAGSLGSLYEQVREQRASQRSIVLARERVRDSQTARRLALDADAELIYIKRLRFADEEPLALDRAWLPANLAGQLLEIDLTDTGLYVELARTCGIRDLYGSEQIRPVIPSGADRRTLALPDGEAAFSIERITRTGNAEPVEWRHSLVRGDRYTINVDARSGGPSGAASPWSASLDVPVVGRERARAQTSPARPRS
jgi:GntR family transcriptional regulator